MSKSLNLSRLSGLAESRPYGSCQNQGGKVWLGFSTADDAAHFIRALAVEPSPDIESLYERQTGTGDNAWEWTTWFEPQMMEDPDFSLLIELHFPRSDLAEVTARLEANG